jgi:hypothetical protein
MNATKLILPGAAVALATCLLAPSRTEAFSTLGFSLPLGQRDVRVFNNFTDAAANNNVTPDPAFPGSLGAALAIWKGCIEWGSRLHGDGSGDPHQAFGLGSGGANFDCTWQGLTTVVGGINENIHSELAGSDGGVLAFTESPSSNGWRIRYYSGWTWHDGPGTSIPGIDLQGVACHEYGHAIGLGHSGVNGATMEPAISGSGVSARSIATDDILGVQSIYGAASQTKPVITALSFNAGQLQITGSSFSGSGNEVWFTKSGTGGVGDPVKLTAVTSTGGGTQITVTVPAGVGPGDVLVRNNGSGHANLSNAWPFDPAAGPTCEPTNFCSASPNSVGPGAFMSWVGTTSIATNDFQLTISGLPPGAIGIFYTGNQETLVPFGNGLNCIGGPVLRFGAMNADSLGTLQRPIDFNVFPGNQMSSDGTPWYFQFWYRNPAGGGAGFNTSDGVTTIWCD